MVLVRQVHLLTRTLPREEQFGLGAQLRRAAVSIPSNIAEGNGRQGRGEYLRFLRVARGSLQELETQLLIAGDLGYIPADRVQQALDLADEVSRMLSGLIRSIGRLASAEANR